MAKIQAMRVVKSLIQKGLLKKEARRNKDNEGSTSNLYTLLNLKPKDKNNNDYKNEGVSDRYPGGVPQISGVVSHRYPNNTTIKNTDLSNVNTTGREDIVGNSRGEIKEETTEGKEDINNIRRKIKESLEEKGKCNFIEPKDSGIENNLLEKNTKLKGKDSINSVVREYRIQRRND